MLEMRRALAVNSR